MPRRVIAFLLSFVLLWSGLTTVEAPSPFAQNRQAQTMALADAFAPAVHAGSVAHHHLDDLPSQAPGEPPIETPALLPASLAAHTRLSGPNRPQMSVLAQADSPFLAGPLRPPCGIPAAG